MRVRIKKRSLKIKKKLFLYKRASENEKQIDLRLKNAELELKTAKKLGIFTEILNEDLEISYKNLLKYINQNYLY